MIHSDVQVTKVCSVQLYTTGNTKLPEDELTLQAMASGALPDGDWTFREIVWDSENNAVVWFEEDE